VLIDAVWGAARSGADNRLQMAIARLRRALEPLNDTAGPRLQTVSGGYRLAIEPFDLDAEVFANRVRDGRAALDAGIDARGRSGYEAQQPAEAPAGISEHDPQPQRIARLPLAPTPTIGREREVEVLAGLLRSPDSRLVTLIGPGGVGKTRLALAVASEMGSFFPHGVCWAELPGSAVPTMSDRPSHGRLRSRHCRGRAHAMRCGGISRLNVCYW
jgi:Transcriptional regulatory protein, C terminal